MLTLKGDAIYGKKVVLVCLSNESSTVTFFSHNEKDVGGCKSSNQDSKNTSKKDCYSGLGYDITRDLTSHMVILIMPFCNSSVEGTWSCTHISTATINVQCLCE